MLIVRTSRVGIRVVIKSLARLFSSLTLMMCFVGVSALQAQTLQAQTLQAQKNTFFIENKGQWDRNALGTPRFLAKTPGALVWVMNDGFVYDFRRQEREKGFIPDASFSKHEREEAERKHTRTLGHVVKMRFAEVQAAVDGNNHQLNNNNATVLIGENKQSGYHNYFLGTDSTKWRSNVPLWGEVRMKNIADGADARIYFDGGSVRYDVIVAPGYDPNRLALEFEGLETDNIRVNKSGELVMQTSIGEVTQGKLFAYQEDKSGKKTPVPCRFEIRRGGTVSFALGAYDRSRPLVIDPLIYSTYIGGAGAEMLEQFALDASGNIYLAGRSSGSFPTTAGAYQTVYGTGANDVIVTKLNAAGSALIYSTYIGGTGDDQGVAGVALDAGGNVYVAGHTTGGYPTTAGAAQTTFGGGTADAFITKINATGTALVYSTYCGGTGVDQCFGIVIDASDNAYITGQSNGSYPTTAGAYQTVYGGGLNDVIVTKINPTGTTRLYSTYIGGTTDDNGFDIAVDASGNAYITGNSSGNYPTTVGAYQTVLGGSRDAIVTKLNATGTGLVYSTYIGGNQSDRAFGMSIDASGSIYITGRTAGGTYPITVGAYQTTYGGGGNDVFVTKLNPAGSALAYSTFIGGAGDDTGHGIFVDASGIAYVTGQVATGFPTTALAYQTAYGGGTFDAFVTKVNPTGASLIHSTYLGGAGNDVCYAVAVDASANVYLAGETSGSFPTTAGAYRTVYGGGALDAFFTKLTLPDPMTVLGNVPPFTPRPTTTPLMNTMNVGTPTVVPPIKVPTNIDVTFSQNLAPWVFTNGISPNARTAMKVHSTTSRGYRSGAGFSGSGATLTFTTTASATSSFNPGEQVWVTVTNAQSTLGAATRPFVMGFRTRAGAGPATFVPGPVPSVSSPAPQLIVEGDFNGDGFLDFAMVSNILTTPTLNIILSTGLGTFAPSVNLSIMSTTVRAITAGDFDNDGDLDLSILNGGGFMPLFINNGSGVFSQVTGANPGSAFRGAACADLDGDGYLDIVASENGNGVRVILNNGGATPIFPIGAAPLYSTGGAGTNPLGVICGDFDGDGDIDIATANSGTNNVGILRNNGMGVFFGLVSYGAGTSPQGIACGDVNGDGLLDLAVANDGGNVSILINNLLSPGTFLVAANYTAGTNPRSVTLSDFDGDGDLDFAVTNNGSNNVSVYLNSGTGTFSAAGNYSVGTSPVSIASGDFNGDGAIDLVTANSGSNNASVLFNTPLMNVLGNIPPFTPRPTTTPLMNTMNVGTPAGSPVKVPTNIDITFSQNLAPWVFTNGTSPNARDAMKVHSTTSRGYRSGAGFSGSGATLTFTTTASATSSFNPGEQVWVTVTNAQSTGGAPTRPFVMGFRTRAGNGPATFVSGPTLTNPTKIPADIVSSNVIKLSPSSSYEAVLRVYL